MEDAHGKALKLCYENRIDLPHAQPRRESFEIEESPRGLLVSNHLHQGLCCQLTKSHSRNEFRFYSISLPSS